MTLPKVYHIHTDLKFAKKFTYFPESHFDNKYILISKSSEGENHSDFMLFGRSSKDINKLIELISDGAYILFYDLDPIKAHIACNVPSGPKLIWRFFGYELYRRIPQVVLSPTSLIWQKKGNEKFSFAKLYESIKSFFFGKSDYLIKAMKRIDFFMCLSEAEYQFLRQYFQLPPFLCIPHNYNFKYVSYQSSQRKNTVIIGNSRAIYNNHLDVLKTLKDNQERIPSKYEFKVLFNYGQDNEYAAEVRRVAGLCKNVTIIDEFMPMEEFVKFYTTVSALVIAGYRQMAMGNIVTALHKGVKLYLSPKNCMYSWLLDLGFAVFDVASLIDDLEHENISLTLEQHQMNTQGLQKINKLYSNETFLKQLNIDLSKI